MSNEGRTYSVKHVVLGAITPEAERRACVVLTPKTGVTEYVREVDKWVKSGGASDEI